VEIYTYVVTRDYGFAPNPFYGMCTLATCKPGIRKSAQIGDWVLGIGSKSTHKNRLIYMMKVTNKVNFNEYWENKEYDAKKPMMTTLKKMYGDNIYHYNKAKNIWIQADSHHSLENGAVNLDNLNRDTQTDNVLISREFYYFGKSSIVIPATVYKWSRGYRRDKETASFNIFLKRIRKTYTMGYIDDPILFTRFKRYDGVS
jgi:hypothetical protein